MSGMKWVGLSALLIGSAAMAQAVPSAKSMSECLLTLDQAKAQVNKLRVVKEQDLSDANHDEYEITYDSSGFKPFGLKARALYYATYSDEVGSDIMLQSELVAGYEVAKDAFLRVNGRTSCWKEEGSDNNRVCRLEPAPGNGTPTRTLRETQGQVDVMCTYYQ